MDQTSEQPKVPQPPHSPTPPYAPAQPVPPTMPPQVVAQTNNSQVFGILGIVFPFIGLALIGLIFSIISVVQASKAHLSKTLGIVGIVLNAIGVLLGGLWLIFMVFIATAGIQERAQTNYSNVSQASKVSTAASDVMRKAEAYYTLHEKYPATIAEFEVSEETSLKDVTTDTGVNITSAEPTNWTNVQYKACGATGAEVVYLTSSRLPSPYFLGDASEKTCE